MKMARTGTDKAEREDESLRETKTKKRRKRCPNHGWPTYCGRE